MRARACRSKFRNCWRSAKASLVYRPCLSAFLLPGRAPEPAAPPCIRQRFFPRTAGDIHGFPKRVLAPQRGLPSIGPVFRLWLAMLIPAAPRCRFLGASFTSQLAAPTDQRGGCTFAQQCLLRRLSEISDIRRRAITCQLMDVELLHFAGAKAKKKVCQIRECLGQPV